MSNSDPSPWLPPATEEAWEHSEASAARGLPLEEGPAVTAPGATDPNATGLAATAPEATNPGATPENAADDPALQLDRAAPPPIAAASALDLPAPADPDAEAPEPDSRPWADQDADPASSPTGSPTAPPLAAAPGDDNAFPGEVEMTMVEHLEELRRRLLRCLLALVIAAAGCLLAVKPLVRLLELPAQGIRFLQLAPGEFLLVSLKVAGYAGLVLALPWMLFEALAFVLPGLTRRERRLVAPAVAGSTLLFLAGLAFAWWALLPAALRFLVSYGADVVEPIWSIERYLDFVLLLMVATALAFQLPVLQLLLGALGLLDAATMLAAWRWVVLVSALAGAVLTPSTDPLTMLLLSGAITALYLIGVGLVALVGRPRPRLDQA
jgi:sec-independent protein translocase protein TatC